MIEFKQIIGRGTRLYDYKYYFTIHDFVNASKQFSNPEWDGEEIEQEPMEKRPASKPRDPIDKPLKSEMIKIKLADGKERTIQHMVQTMFYGPDGKPMFSTEFIKSLFGTIPSLFKNEEELRSLWSDPITRKKLLDQLSEGGFTQEHMEEVKKLINAEKKRHL